jgi:hypothetical protein
LDTYYRNFSQYGHLDRVNAIVIPDRKTPAAVYERCNELRRAGFDVRCPTLEQQEEFLRKVGLPASAVPYDSDNRRNVGYLMALESSCDFVISIDDDNYCQEGDDTFSQHAVCCLPLSQVPVVDSSTGYFNFCSLLHFERDLPVYPRGYPYAARHSHEEISTSVQNVPVHLNAGLWTLDPDVDAISWLTLKPRVIGFGGRSVALSRNTWGPVNTQNTGLRRDALAAYYFVRMGFRIEGSPIDRYADIFPGYFLQACTKHLGGFVRVGTPVAEHRRNSHDYMKDATNEWSCILVLEDLVPWLRGTALSGRSYAEVYHSLSELIEDAVESFRGAVWTEAARGYFHQMAFHMRRWRQACETIGGANA